MTGSYLAEIERTFLARAGRGLMISSRDIELVRRWERAGVPLEVVVQAIDDVFDRRDESGASGPVRGLAYVAPAVDAAHRAWLSRRVGRRDALSPPGAEGDALRADFDRLLAELATAATAQADRRLGELCNAALERVRDLRDRAATGELDAPGEALADVERDLVDAALAALAPEVATALRAEAEVEMAEERMRADRAEWAMALRAHLRRRARRRLGLPALSLHLGRGRW